jgi:hypothetical protein
MRRGPRRETGAPVTTDPRVHVTELMSADAISEAIRAATWNDHTHSIREQELLALTALLDSHPEWWEWPCMCGECREYVDG